MNVEAMDVEDDNLKALRSAALATLSNKAQKPIIKTKKEEDEDLEALRLAALMTRKQNQIQVIQRPVPTQGPYILTPATFHRPRQSWTTNNLISLTPGPPTGSFGSQPRLEHPASISNPQSATRKPAPIAAQSDISEPKFAGKFSRYDTDSSSDEDDEHTADKRKTSDCNESDAESTISEKSYSSASDTGDNESKLTKGGQPKKDMTECQKDNFEDAHDAKGDESADDDNISIINNEEDDILAAIDDFLEGRTDKSFNESSKNVDTRQIPQVANKGDAKSSLSKTERKKTKPISASEVSSPGKRTSSKIPSKLSKTDVKSCIKSKISFQSDMKQSKETTERSLQRKRGKLIKKSEVSEKRSIKISSETLDASRYLNKSDSVTTFVNRGIPSPPRQRRDSDLDSVGTSDLSFISSDGEDDEKQCEPVSNLDKKNESNTTEPLPNDKKRKSCGDPQSRIQNGSPSLKVIQEVDRLHERNTSDDLRKKLERKGLAKKPLPDARTSEKQENTEYNAKTKATTRNSGVINLKKRSARLSANHEPQKESDSEKIFLPDLNEAKKIIVTKPNASTHALKTNLIKQKKTAIEGNVCKKLPSHGSAETRPMHSDDTVQKKIHADNTADEKILRLYETPQNVKSRETKKQQKRASRLKQTTAACNKPLKKKIDDLSVHSSDSDGAIFHEEEVFAFDKSDLPLYDEVLGNVDDSEDEMIAETRRKSRSDVKTERSADCHSVESRDSRRIISKTSLAHASESKKDKNHLRSKISKISKRALQAERMSSLNNDSELIDWKSSELQQTDDEMDIPWKKRPVESKLKQTKLASFVSFSSQSQNSKHSLGNDDKESKRPADKGRKILVSGRRVSPYRMHRTQKESTEKARTLRDWLGEATLTGTSTPLSKKRRALHGEGNDGSSWKQAKSKTLVQRKDSQTTGQEDILEARIQRIKKQNGLILKRQKEIQLEKEKFGF